MTEQGTAPDQDLELELAVTMIPVGDLTPDPENARAHGDRNLEAIKASIARFGVRRPLIVSKAGVVVAGNGTLEALRALGAERVAVTYLPWEDLDKCRAYAIADNRTAELAEWNEGILLEQLTDLELKGWALEELGFESLAELGVSNSDPGEAGDRSGPTLTELFGVPPFSVLDQRAGYWQERKRRWLQLGILSEVGRGENLLAMSEGQRTRYQTSMGFYRPSAGGGAIQREGGGWTATSVFDPVLCELTYRWWCPPGGQVLDPFAGGSVRGVVAAALGRHYHGIELRAEQVEANRNQWSEIAPRLKSQQAPASPLEPRPAEGRPVMRPRNFQPGALASEALDLYGATSSRPMRRAWGPTPASLAPYLRHVYEAMGEELELEEIPTEPWGQAIDNGTIWVAFSGGKDGMAAALLARAQGLRPILYHVHGINRSWPDELTWAEHAARALAMPLLVDRVSVAGKKAGLVELPTKNQVTAELMLSRMAEFGGALWTMGVMAADTPDTMRPELNWSDNTDAVRLFADHLSARLPGSRFVPLLAHESESLAIVAGAGALDYAHGCMAPLRFRAQYRNRNEEKFGELLPGRCGSCTKCCSETLALWHLGHPAVGEGLYQHALAFMGKVVREEHPEDTAADPLAHYIDVGVIEAQLEARAGAPWPSSPAWEPEQVPPPRKLTNPAVLSPGEELELPPPAWTQGDSRQLEELLPAELSADLVFSCPPYADLEVYSDDPADLSTLPYPEFLKAYREIIAAAVARLKPDRFAVWVVGEVRGPSSAGGIYQGLVPDTIKAFEDAGAAYYNEAILVSPVGSLMLRAGRIFSASRKLGKIHQNVLVFVKGDPKAAADACGTIDVTLPDEPDEEES